MKKFIVMLFAGLFSASIAANCITDDCQSDYLSDNLVVTDRVISNNGNNNVSCYVDGNIVTIAPKTSISVVSTESYGCVANNSNN